MRLNVYVKGKLVAHLDRQADDYALRYTDDATADDFVGLTMPVRENAWVWPRDLHPFFRQNLPEGFLLQVIREAFGPYLDGTDLSLLAVADACRQADTAHEQAHHQRLRRANAVSGLQRTSLDAGAGKAGRCQRREYHDVGRWSRARRRSLRRGRARQTDVWRGRHVQPAGPASAREVPSVDGTGCQRNETVRPRCTGKAVAEAAKNDTRWHWVAKQMLHAWNEGMASLRSAEPQVALRALTPVIEAAGFSDADKADNGREVIGRSELLGEHGKGG